MLVEQLVEVPKCTASEQGNRCPLKVFNLKDARALTVRCRYLIAWEICKSRK